MGQKQELLTEGYDMNTAQDIRTTVCLSNDLRAAAKWLDAHPDLPPVFSISGYEEYGVTINWSGDDSLADAIMALTDTGHDHQYDDGDYRRIATGSIDSTRITLSVAVDR